MSSYSAIGFALGLAALLSLLLVVGHRADKEAQAAMDAGGSPELPGCATVFILLSGVMFLCKDLFIWTEYAFVIPFGAWQVLFGLLSTSNACAIVYPFVVERKLLGRFGYRQANLRLVFALLALWTLNFMVTDALWGAFCNRCYFG